MRPFLRACWLTASSERQVAGYADAVLESGLAGACSSFRLVEGGPQQRAIVQSMERMGRAMEVGDSYQFRPDWLVLAELDTLDAALSLEVYLDDFRAEGLVPIASGIYREVATVSAVQDEPEGLGPAVQFGVFDMRSAEDERAVSEWYRDRRLPSFAQLPGAIRARQYVSACGGPGKFAILYEFSSLEARLRHFEPMNAADHELPPENGDNPGVAARLIADRTVHPPLSPSIGVSGPL